MCTRPSDERAAEGPVADERLTRCKPDQGAEAVVNCSGCGSCALPLVLVREHEHERLRLLRPVLRCDGRDGVRGAARLPVVLFRVEVERDVRLDRHHGDEATCHSRGGLDAQAARERRILLQDAALELAERVARLEPELLEQVLARVAIGIERLGLPAGLVEGKHQLPSPALA